MACAALSIVGFVGTVLAEEAWRIVWTGRYGFNDQSPASNYTTSNRDDAFRFARERMELSMRQAYSRCAPPIITFVREIDRTAGSGLLYYGWPEWRIDYLDGSSCSYWNSVNTIGEIFSGDRRFETGPVDERSCTTANPVQPGSGRMRFEETDYSGAGAHALNLKRHYNSRWTDSAAATGLAPIAAWDGGWRHSYQASLTLRTNGTLRAFRPDGSMLGLDPSLTVADTWTTAGSRDSVAALLDASGQRAGYTYTSALDDSTETYDAGGRLLNTRLRNGWTTTLTYSDATTPQAIAPWPGLLIAVRNQFGRELKFTYDALGRVAELLPPGAISSTPAGSPASPIRYMYGEAASLGAGVPSQGQLTAVTWQDGTARRYHYEDGRWPQAVTGITDEAGVRNGTYAYDAEGRVLRSELAGGAARLDFAYGTDAGGNPTTTVTDYSGPGGSATSRTYTFADIGGVRHPSGVTAPCSLCGNTQQQSSYNAQGDPTKAIAHDGTVTFYAYNAKGQETERATFPASFNTATTRPALANATKVVSTKWHGTFNLPTQVAEPGKFTANTYNAKGMLTGQSWTATTDATGAAKFNAVNTGSTYATGWGYNANSLNTSIVTRETAQGSTTAVETARWTLAYEANGDTRRVTAVVAGATAVATLTSSATHGQLTTLSVDNGALAQFGYDARNRLVTAQLPDYGATLTHDARSLLTEVRFGPSNWLRIVYDAAGQPLRVEDSSGASQTIAEMSGWPDAEPALLQLRNWLAGLRALPPTAWLPMASARAQVPPPPPIPASVLQGMSLAQSQQSALAADALGQAMQGRCCGSAQPSLAGVQSQLQRVTLPIQLMSLAFTQAAEVMRDEFLTLKSAYKLRKNLCAAGVTELAGCHHAHHIVAVAHPRAQTSRDILASASVGIDVNDAVNGMFVPCDRHGRLHTYAYYDKVRDRLLAVNPRNRATISAALTQIRLEIASGTF